MGMDVEQFKKILKAVKGLPWKEGGSHPRLASRDYLIFVILGNLGLSGRAEDYLCASARSEGYHGLYT